MELFDLIDPVSLDRPDEYLISSPNILGKHLVTHTPNYQPANLEQFEVAILGIPEDRKSLNKGASLAPEKIRAQLHQLYKMAGKVKVVDLGNIKQGNTFTDTYFAVKEVIQYLRSRNVVTILLGGTQELTIPVFQVYESLQKNINLTTVDRTIDILKDSLEITAESFLTEFLFKKRKLFKYCNLGHQVHLTDPENIDLIHKLYHEARRLGDVRANMAQVEPILRDSDIVSFDISALRQSEAPGFFNSSPSGFYSEEACQIARYAGISDRVSCFGLFEVNPKYDATNQTAKTAAQIIWYFLDGFSCRNVEFPQSENSNFKTFIVGHSDLDHEITFYKSLITERWWMEIPANDTPTLVSCSYEDYLSACKQEVPDLWWKSYQKLS